MATDQRNLPAFLSDDATFRTWGSGIAAQLATVGLVQAADTGQINWTTVTRPGTSTYAGYEIWRFNDSLQATKPVFIKIEYGIGTVADRPALRLTVSTATNGAGTPSGQVSSVRTLAAGTSYASGATNISYCSGDSGRLNLATNYLNPGTNTGCLYVLLERTQNIDGSRTGDAVIFFTFLGNGTSAGYQVIPFSGAIPSAGSFNYGLQPGSSGSQSAVGADVAVSPSLAFFGKTFLVSWCCFNVADIGAQSTFTMSHLGATHTFLAVLSGGGTSCLIFGVGGVAGLAMLWE